MKWYKEIADALKQGKCFQRGNYMVSSHNSSKHGYCSDVFYYGHKVFHYSHHSTTHTDQFNYDFCGFEGHSRTTKVINCCLEAVGAKFRTHCVKGKVIEVPVTSKTSRYN